VVAGVTGLKDLHDSIDFIRTLAEKKLQKRFKEKYGDNFRIDVSRQIPRDLRHWDDYKFMKEQFVIPVSKTGSNSRAKRDSCFYYLLISNIVLLAVIIALVARAVIEIYF